MPAIAATIRRLTRDGVYNDTDLEATARELVQSRGLTKKQLADLKKEIVRLTDGSVELPHSTYERANHFYRQIARRYSHTTGRFAANVDSGEVKSWLDIRADYAKKPARNTRTNEVDLHDPRMPARTLDNRGKPNYAKMRIRGRVAARPPRVSDVVEGWIDDCPFSAGSAGLFDTHGEWFYKHSFKDHHDGTYSFRFFQWDGRRYRPQWIRVDRDLYIGKAGKPLFGKGPGKAAIGNLFFPLLEKAAAMFLGGSYSALDHGGNAEEVIKIMLPGTSHWKLLKEVKSTDSLYKMLARIKEKKWPAFFESWLDGDPRGKAAQARGIITSHTYAFLGLHEEGGKRYVKLYNPWAHGETRGHKKLNGKDDGICYLPIEDVAKCFENLSWLNPRKSLL